MFSIKKISNVSIVFVSLVTIALVFSMVGFTHAEGKAFGVYNLPDRGNSADFIPDEVVVRFKNDSVPFRVKSVNKGQSVAQAVASFSQNPNVEYAEPNFIATAYAVPNDTFYNPYQWNFDNDVNGGVHAEAAWDVSTGAGTIVAVVDTGIAYEDYTSGRGRFRQGYTQAPDLAGVCFTAGYDFVNNDSHPNDDDSHGTHVAGTIAQRTNNNSGTAGLAYDSCLMPVKVLNQNGSGSYADIASGIRYATDNGADVINLSLGGPSGSQVLHDAVLYAYNNGVTVFAATGNDNGAIGYPAAYDDAVIAVGATRYDEARAPYSNFGSSIDIVAPGGDTNVDQNGDGYIDGILQNTFNPNTGNVNDFGYWFFNGTSMAAPHVAAAAAMVISNGNATTPDQVREALQSTADDIGVAGRDDYYGHGLLNIEAALAWTAGPVDNAPSSNITSPTEGSVVVGSVSISADASDDNGIDKVEFYVDGSLLAIDTVSPYEATWNSASSSEGSHTITATAVDNIGQSTSDDVSVTVDNVNDAPSADAGSDQEVIDENEDGFAFVSLDGSGSNDSDGTISMYSWSEGGIVIATGSNPYIEMSLGSHNVELTVTDDEGATDTDMVVINVVVPPVTPDITLELAGSKTKGKHAITLTWFGANGANVDIHRDGTIIATTDNDGNYFDQTDNRGGRTYIYQVCEEGTSILCSAEVEMLF